jgi:hypothetical protein
MSSSSPARGRAPMDTSVDSAEASEDPTGEEPQQAATPTNLSESSLAAVLLYGLTLDDEEPAMGVLLGARRELRLIESLAEAAAGPGVEFDVDEIAPVIESIGRRLDVAIELFNRAKREESTSTPPANAAPPSAPTGSEPMAAESPGTPGAKD